MTTITPRGRLARTLAGSVAVAALAVTTLLPGVAFATRISPPSVPATIQVPAGNKPFLLGHATGTQNYTCQLTSSGYAWTLVGPVATLVDDKGKQIMTHYAGPTWEGNDGSKVVGMVVGRANSPDPDAIPWLLLQSTANAGPGIFTPVTYIQRLETVGGLAPTEGCDRSTVDSERDVTYMATYLFYVASGDVL